jgi:hypothetical protein
MYSNLGAHFGCTYTTSSGDNDLEVIAIQEHLGVAAPKIMPHLIQVPGKRNAQSIAVQKFFILIV